MMPANFNDRYFREDFFMDAQSQWTGLDAARLERIDDHLQRNYIGPQKIAGCQVLVSRRGNIRAPAIGMRI